MIGFVVNLHLLSLNLDNIIFTYILLCLHSIIYFFIASKGKHMYLLCNVQPNTMNIQ